MKDVLSKPIRPNEQKFWTRIKVFLFCDADQPMTLSQLACVWLLVAVASRVFLMCANVMISNL